MLFRLLLFGFLFSNPVFSDRTGVGYQSKEEKILAKTGEEETSLEAFKDMEKLNDSGLFVVKKENSLPVNINISDSIRSSMIQSCYNAYKLVQANTDSYNKNMLEIQKTEEVVDEEIFQANINHVNNIKAGVKACVTEVSGKFRSLSHEFAKPLVQNYNLLGSVGPFKTDHIVYLDDTFIGFIKSNFVNLGKQGEIKKVIEHYDRFQSECIATSNNKPGIFALTTAFQSDTDLEKSYEALTNFLSQNADCLNKYKELSEVIRNQVFNEFVNLPLSCASNDPETKIEILKKSVLLDNKGSVEYPDVLNYCKEEVKKTSYVCYCGEEECKIEDDTVLKEFYTDSKEVCNKEGLLNTYLNGCKGRAEKCFNLCNARLIGFKEEYKNLFFTSYLNLRTKNIHAQYKTSCLQDMEDIHKNFKDNVSNKTPYAEEGRLKSGSLLIIREIGEVCKAPFEAFEKSYENWAKQCGKKEDTQEEDTQEENTQAKKNDIFAGKDLGTGWGSRSVSQEDQIRRNAQNNSRYGGSDRDTESSQYTQRGVSNVGVGGVGNLGGSGNFNSLNPGTYGEAYGEKNYGLGKEADGQGYGSAGTDGSAGTSGGFEATQLESTTTASGGDFSGMAGDGGFLSRTVANVKKKGTEALETTGQHVRDYLLSDTKMWQYKNGYTQNAGRQNSGGLVSGISKKIREVSHEAYNTVVPIKREEFRKRMGFYSENVNLFEVSDLWFCRICLRDSSATDKSKCSLEDRGRCGSLRSVVTRTNELAESQVVTPEEQGIMQKEKEKGVEGLTFLPL